MEAMHNSGTIVEALDGWAQVQPDRVVYRFLPDGEGRPYVLTYGQLRSRSQAIAGCLEAWKGQRALLLFHSGLEFLEAFLGCLYAGVIAVPAYPPRKNHGMARIRAIIDDCTPQVILTKEDIRQFAEPMFTEEQCTSHQWRHRDIRWINTDRIKDEPAANKPPASSQIAFLQYTSGSTGTPKGVMVSHGNLMHNLRMIHSVLLSGPQHRVVSWLPLFHDMGLIGGALYPLFQGIDALLMPPAAFLQKPFRWLKAVSDISTQGPVGTVAPNFAWQICVDQISEEQRATLDLSGLQYALTGAEPVRASTLDAFAIRFRENGFQRKVFCPCYGLAEATLFVTAAGNREPVVRNVSAKLLGNNRLDFVPGEDSCTLVSSGRPQCDEKLLIVDPVSGKELDTGGVGEVWVNGPHTCQGYWNQPEVSQAAFNNFTSGGKGPFVRTGDLGAMVDGELFVTGRLKDLIIIRGRNIYPHDVEFVAEQSHAALQSGGSAAFTIDKDGEEKLIVVAEVERSQRLHLDSNAICTRVREAITKEFGITVHAMLLLKPGALLKTSSGKVQRNANRLRYLGSGFAVLAEWNNPSLEDKNESDLFMSAGDFHSQTHESLQALLKCWVAQEGHIAIEEVEADVPFESHGIDSINAMRLVASLETWAGFPISIDTFIENDTIEKLAGYLIAEKMTSTRAVSAPRDMVEGTI